MSAARQSERRLALKVDLTGSNCGPDFLGVELVLSPPEDWTDQRIRQGAADYYAVPLDQVGEPEEIDAAIERVAAVLRPWIDDPWGQGDPRAVAEAALAALGRAAAKTLDEVGPSVPVDPEEARRHASDDDDRDGMVCT